MIKEFTFFIEEFNSSGGIKITSSICNLLLDDGNNVRVVVLNPKNKTFYDLNEKIQVFSAPSKVIIHRLIWMGTIVLKSKSINVTPNFRILFFLYFLSFFKSKSLKNVFLIQGIDNFSILNSGNPIVRVMNKIFYKISKILLANRIFVSQHIKNIYNKEGVVIPNYCSDIFFNPEKKSRKYKSKKSPLVIGIVSTSSPNKGFNLFIDFVNYMQLNHSHLHLVFKCATQDTNLINNYSKSNVTFESPKGDHSMANFYNSCDFLFSLSFSEGFNLPIIEAMASGCVVFSTDDGGSSEIISHEVNGIILMSRDVYAIGQQFLSSFKNEILLNKISESAVSTAFKYSENSFNNSYLTYFKSNYD
jgi:glycosyltransferase involved in cell wall biosynthesis